MNKIYEAEKTYENTKELASTIKLTYSWDNFLAISAKVNTFYVKLYKLYDFYVLTTFAFNKNIGWI